MKNRKFIVTILLLFTAALSFLVSSCDIKSPVEGLEVRLKTLSRTTTAAVRMKDAATGSLISNPVSVTFRGEDKELVISSTNVAITSANSNQGILTFSIKDDITPTTDNPIDLTLVCKTDGYITTSKNIKITKAGISNFSVSMVSDSNVPTGAVSNTESTGSTDSQNGISEDINISSGRETNSNAQATVSVPAGTRLIGADGNALNGDVVTRVAYFNPLDEESVNSFPGGLNVNVTNESGNNVNGQFVTAGFVAVDMTVNGEEVERFENGTLQLNIEIPEGVMNPITGQQVQSGDVIPLWSYDEDNGEWKFEQNITVNGQVPNLKVSGKNLTHLTYWNLDWFIDNVTNCTFKEISFTASGCMSAVWLEIKYTLNGTLYPLLAQEQNVSQLTSDNLYLYNFPDLPYTIKIYEMVNGVKTNNVLFSVENEMICGPGVFNINIPPGSNNLQEVNLNVSIVCDSQSDNPRVITPDGYTLYAQKVGTNNWEFIGGFDNGQMTACLEVGESYIFGMEYDGDWYQSDDYEPPFQITGTSINYSIVDDDRVCDNF